MTIFLYKSLMTTTESSSKEEFDNQLKTLSAIKHCFLHAACTNTAHYIVFSLLYINTLFIQRFVLRILRN